MKLLVQYGVYQCATCHNAVMFEADPTDPYGSRQLRMDGTAVGACVALRCPERHKRFTVRLPTIEVEEAPRLAEAGDLWPLPESYSSL